MAVKNDTIEYENLVTYHYNTIVNYSMDNDWNGRVGMPEEPTDAQKEAIYLWNKQVDKKMRF